MVVRNLTRGVVLGTGVKRADSFFRRLRGLMFRRRLEPGEGLFFAPCNSVHTHFMRIAIDVLFLDREKRVVHVIAAMAPWKVSPIVRGAAAVLEFGAGAAGDTAVGDQLELV